MESFVRNTLILAKRAKWILSGKVSRYLDLDLVILDDFFPHVFSAFRVTEYNYYLKLFPKSVVYSTADNFSIVHDPRSFFDVKKEYEDCYPEFQDRVIRFSDAGFSSKLAYMVFLSNADQFAEYLNKRRIPFIFTLYPGGGFYLDHEDSDRKLSKVCSLSYLRKIIVTQKKTYEYLLEKNFIDSSKIEFIYGGVFPADFYGKSMKSKQYYKVEKNTFDICFVANKYMPLGLDKGYDKFIEVAKIICHNQDIKFHVVGSFNEFDIDVSILKDRITFYGTQRTDFFPDFYSKMDIILSPNVPYTLAPGAFDGFPTGCCVEAALCQVAVFCTDTLNQNIYFTDKENIALISTNPDEISKTILSYYSNPKELYRIAHNGKEIFEDIFSIENQIEPRIRLIQSLLE